MIARERAKPDKGAFVVWRAYTFTTFTRVS